MITKQLISVADRQMGRIVIEVHHALLSMVQFLKLYFSGLKNAGEYRCEKIVS